MRPAKSPANGKKVVYLTFDDGPSPTYTPQVLKILSKHKIHATFFVIGEEANDNPKLVQQERAAGHSIGNHTYDHKDLATLSDADVRSEIAKGVSSHCLRPPYGSINTRVKDIITGLGMSVVMWDVDPTDWARPGTDAIEQRVLAGAGPGTIILMHDGGGDRSQSVAALDTVITTLQQRGYSFATLDC